MSAVFVSSVMNNASISAILIPLDSRFVRILDNICNEGVVMRLVRIVVR